MFVKKDFKLHCVMKKFVSVKANDLPSVTKVVTIELHSE